MTDENSEYPIKFYKLGYGRQSQVLFVHHCLKSRDCVFEGIRWRMWIMHEGSDTSKSHRISKEAFLDLMSPYLEKTWTFP